MKLALIAITKHGAKHALKLRSKMPDAALYILEKQKATNHEGARYFETMKDLTSEIWDKVDGLVYFVSLGAVIRTIAPCLKAKDTDPAVVVVDDASRFAISVLSGHGGGANELTQAIALALGATAVVTTASDVHATIPVDILGRELGWTLEDKTHVTPVSAAMVNEKPVAFIQECGEKNWWSRPTPLPKNVSLYVDIAKAKPSEAYLVVSDRSTDVLKAELAKVWDKVVIYRPKTLYLGMGCDQGTDLDEVWGLLESSFAEAGLSPKSIAQIASIDLKANEESLHLLSQKIGVSLKFFTSDELNSRGVVSPANPMVKKHTGAIGVSEPAAMLAAGVASLLVTKKKSQRATLAVSRREF